MDRHPHYLTWMKNKYIVNSNPQTSMSALNNSWEEQAFVHDLAFIWPPRSYTCSFCKRKFRSAQALGGHMNVHKRDKTRLKLSPTSQNEGPTPNQNYNLSSNHNPKPKSDPNFPALPISSCVILYPKIGFEKNLRSREDSRLMGDDEAVDLSIGLNLVVCVHNEEIKSKRHKSDVLPMPLFLEPCSKGLDLELRLGDSPKMK